MAAGKLECSHGQKVSAAETVLLFGFVLSLVVSCILWSSRKQEWVDEIYTWTELNDPSLWHLYSAIQHGADGGMPLFYTTAWIWARVVGTGALALRFYSCAAICGAFFVLWKTVRRAYGVHSTALGVMMVWGTSPLILDQNAEARYYGLYTLMVVIAIAFFMRLAEQRNPKPALLLAGMLAQSALVLSHVLGILYGGLILVALILVDVSRRRVRPVVYLSQAAGWLALLVWIPAIRASAATGRPHGWITMPNKKMVLLSYDFLMPLVSILASHHRVSRFALPAFVAFLALVALAVVTALVVLVRRLMTRQAFDAALDPKLPLLIVAFCVLAVPLLLLLLSHLVTPLFVPRYALPSATGITIIFVAFAHSVGMDRIQKTLTVVGFAWITIVLVLLTTPVVAAALVGPPVINWEYLDVPHLDTLIPLHVPVVVGWQHDFFKVMRYSSRADRPYIFLLDLPTALNGPVEFVPDFHLMSNYRQSGYYSANIQNQSDFLCSHPFFLLLEHRSMSWLPAAKEQLPGLQAKVVARIDDERDLVAVSIHRTAALTPCKSK